MSDDKEKSGLNIGSVGVLIFLIFFAYQAILGVLHIIGWVWSGEYKNSVFFAKALKCLKWACIILTPTWTIAICTTIYQRYGNYGVAFISTAIAIVVSIVVYNLITKRNREKAANRAQQEFDRAQQEFDRAEQEALDFLDKFLIDLGDSYTEPQKHRVIENIARRDILQDFYLSYDDADRLFVMGDTTGKHIICYLPLLTEEQQKAKVEAAWDSKRLAQRNLQLAKNAAEKLARKLARLGHTL